MHKMQLMGFPCTVTMIIYLRLRVHVMLPLPANTVQSLNHASFVAKTDAVIQFKLMLCVDAAKQVEPNPEPGQMHVVFTPSVGSHRDVCVCVRVT